MDLLATGQTDRRDDGREDDRPAGHGRRSHRLPRPTAKTKTARLAISTPRKPKAVNEFARSVSAVVEATNRSVAIPARKVTIASRTSSGSKRARNQRIRDGASDQARRAVRARVRGRPRARRGRGRRRTTGRSANPCSGPRYRSVPRTRHSSLSSQPTGYVSKFPRHSAGGRTESMRGGGQDRRRDEQRRRTPPNARSSKRLNRSVSLAQVRLMPPAPR